MKYLKFFIRRMIQLIKGLFITLIPFWFIILLVVMSLFSEGYTLEDFGLDGMTLNPNDYCNLTDVDYTAVIYDAVGGSASAEITEYLTFDVHAGSKSNPFKEVWRELPEDYVDGMKVDYNVKSVTQILPDGSEIPYTETNKMYWEDYDYTPSSTMYWHHSKGIGRYPDNDESLLIYIPWTYRDKLTFKIVYNMNNAALKYNDCSELYLSMYSGNSITKLKSYKAQILIPNDKMPSTYYAYSFGTAKSRIPFTESATKNNGYYTFSMDLDKSDLKFNYHNRYIEFCLLAYGRDRHSFTTNAPNNLYSHDNVLDECIAENEYYENEAKIYNTRKSFCLALSIMGTILIVAFSKQKYYKIRQKYTYYEPEVDYEYFRDIPSDLDPIFASELVFMKDPFDENKEKKEEYAAILLSLVRKKYVTLTKLDSSREWDEHNTVITLTPTNTQYIPTEDASATPTYITVVRNTEDVLEPLTTSERLYLELIGRHTINSNNTITLYHLQKRIDEDYEYTSNFVKNIENKPKVECGVTQGYYQQTFYEKPKDELSSSAKMSLKLSLVFLIIVNAISYFSPMALSFGAYTIFGLALLWRYFYLTIKASNSVLLTQYGATEQAKWYGLYNYLNSDTLINSKNVDDLILWEKYLIYATAFGISEKVVKAIKIHAVDLHIDNSPILNHNCYVHSSHFHTTSRSFGHSIHTSSRGGFGGHGFSGHGYGGGGRGGGGGGGGH